MAFIVDITKFQAEGALLKQHLKVLKSKMPTTQLK